MFRSALLVAILAMTTGCAGAFAPAASVRPASAPAQPPVMRWDHRPEADIWTLSTVRALRAHGAALPAAVPADIDSWCPGYRSASMEEREMFWVGLLSALSKHESTWRPAAVGGGGQWFGLTQISPATARGYGCAARSGGALKDGAANLACAVRIMAGKVTRSGASARGVAGVASDWGPFHNASKRAEMRAWTQAQPFCKAR